MMVVEQFVMELNSMEQFKTIITFLNENNIIESDPTTQYNKYIVYDGGEYFSVYAKFSHTHRPYLPYNEFVSKYIRGHVINGILNE